MDERTIDTISRLLAGKLDRRRLAGGVLTALTSGLAAPRLALAGCKKVGKKCEKNRDCCDHAECKNEKCKCKKGWNGHRGSTEPPTVWLAHLSETNNRP